MHQHGEAHARIGTAQASEGLFVAHCLGVLLALVIHAAKYLTLGLATKGGGFYSICWTNHRSAARAVATAACCGTANCCVSLCEATP